MESSDVQAKESLLRPDGENYEELRALSHRLRETLRRRNLFLAASLVLNTCLLLILVWSLSRVRTRDPQLEVYSPANHVVEYEDVVWYDNIRHFSPYQLAPNDTVDDMWSELYSHTATTRVNAESAKLLPNQTVVIPGTDHEGMVQVEIFHALHCINSLRKSLWPERFPTYNVFQNGTRDDLITTHHMHCIDRLRMNIMCAGNVGTSTWKWRPDAVGGPRWMIDMEMTYRCRKFEPIREWALENEYMGWDDTEPSELTP